MKDEFKSGHRHSPHQTKTISLSLCSPLQRDQVLHVLSTTPDIEIVLERENTGPASSRPNSQLGNRRYGRGPKKWHQFICCLISPDSDSWSFSLLVSCFNSQVKNQDTRSNTYPPIDNIDAHTSLRPDNNKRATTGSDTSSCQIPNKGLTDYAPAQRKSLCWLVRTIEEIYSARLKSYQIDLGSMNHAIPRYAQKYGPQGALGDDFVTFVYTFFTKKFGIETLVSRTCKSILVSVKSYRCTDLEVAMFGSFLCNNRFESIDVLFYLLCREKIWESTFVQLDTAKEGVTHHRRYIWEHELPSQLRSCSKDWPVPLIRIVRKGIIQWKTACNCTISASTRLLPPFDLQLPFLEGMSRLEKCGAHEKYLNESPASWEKFNSFFSSHTNRAQAVDVHAFLFVLLANFYSYRTNAEIHYQLRDMEKRNRNLHTERISPPSATQVPSATEVLFPNRTDIPKVIITDVNRDCAVVSSTTGTLHRNCTYSDSERENCGVTMLDHRQVVTRDALGKAPNEHATDADTQNSSSSPDRSGIPSNRTNEDTLDQNSLRPEQRKKHSLFSNDIYTTVPTTDLAFVMREDTDQQFSNALTFPADTHAPPQPCGEMGVKSSREVSSDRWTEHPVNRINEHSEIYTGFERWIHQQNPEADNHRQIDFPCGFPPFQGQTVIQPTSHTSASEGFFTSFPQNNSVEDEFLVLERKLRLAGEDLRRMSEMSSSL